MHLPITQKLIKYKTLRKGTSGYVRENRILSLCIIIFLLMAVGNKCYDSRGLLKALSKAVHVQFVRCVVMLAVAQHVSESYRV